MKKALITSNVLNQKNNTPNAMNEQGNMVSQK